MIRPVFANTAFVQTRERFVLRGGRGRVRLRVRCGLIVHPVHGPVLIDAGYGPRVTAAPGRSWALRAYAAAIPIALNPLENPLALLADHGFLPEDVKTVIVTHLHADHVSYLRDFPNARFLTDDQQSGTLRHAMFNELLPDDFAARQDAIRSHTVTDLPFGQGQGHDLLGDGSVLAVPLPGHAPGHFGLCFPGETPLLYAVDTQWVCAAILEDRMPGPPLSLTAADSLAAKDSAAFARRFAQSGGQILTCHDPAQSPYDWTPQGV
ncbi:MBL fold metallo-hydrolase [Yoonia sp. BS5-3]|uniref:MBL fold metallo-hydrolase n=1 Tax=Yoonia phaeophyticola TaxID=3137369 RepID=A0ABZ2V0G4_9RHOB